MAQTLHKLAAKTRSKPRKKPDLPQLSKAEIRDLIRLLDVVFELRPRPLFAKRSKRKMCYQRKPIMQIPRTASPEDIIEEYTHALFEKRERERTGAKPHPPAFKLLLAEVLQAYSSGKSPQ